jgi:hypothetical protein
MTCDCVLLSLLQLLLQLLLLLLLLQLYDTVTAAAAVFAKFIHARKTGRTDYHYQQKHDCCCW